MNVASLELCKELYELSEWRDCEWQYWNGTAHNDISEITLEWGYGNYGDNCAPAYDLGYLLRKLPSRVDKGRKNYRFVLTNSTSDESWVADYLMPFWQKGLPDRGIEVWLHYGNRAKLTEADTPEDAVCKLTIELFKQEILHKEPQ